MAFSFELNRSNPARFTPNQTTDSYESFVLTYNPSTVLQCFFDQTSFRETLQKMSRCECGETHEYYSQVYVRTDGPLTLVFKQYLISGTDVCVPSIIEGTKMLKRKRSEEIASRLRRDSSFYLEGHSFCPSVNEKKPPRLSLYSFSFSASSFLNFAFIVCYSFPSSSLRSE